MRIERIGQNLASIESLGSDSGENNILKLIIVAAGSILGLVLILNVWQYELIPLPWKIAIVTFIIVLPISFFLQPLMTYRAIKTERISNYNQRFATCLNQIMSLKGNSVAQDYVSFIEEPDEDESTYHNFLQDSYFSATVRVISVLIYNVTQDSLLSKVYLDMFGKLKEVESKIKDYYGAHGDLGISTKQKSEMEGSLVVKNILIGRLDLLRFNFPKLLDKAVGDELRSENLDLSSYFLPISFFMIIYFGGFLITVPLIGSVFEAIQVKTTIPLINEKVIPIQAVQWGFLGGIVYTSINLINRFLRSDLNPKIYLYGSYRLIFAVVAAIIVYFVYVIANLEEGQLDALYRTSTTILLVCFAIGISPINFLIRFAQSIAFKVMEWKKKDNAGNRNVTIIGGINLVVSERLAEAGVDSIQQLAFCNPNKISAETKFEVETINDWKDQALFYLFTNDVFLSEKQEDSSRLSYVLENRLAVRVFTELRIIWTALDTEEKRKSFVDCLGVIDTKVTESQLLYLFDIITQYDDPYLKLKSHYSVTPKSTAFGIITEKKVITSIGAPIK